MAEKGGDKHSLIHSFFEEGNVVRQRFGNSKLIEGLGVTTARIIGCNLSKVGWRFVPNTLLQSTRSGFPYNSESTSKIYLVLRSTSMYSLLMFYVKNYMLII